MFINVYVQQMIAKLNQKLEEIVKKADTGKQCMYSIYIDKSLRLKLRFIKSTEHNNCEV